ncbi:MAG: ABC transporter substrate-binding protein [Proteobacteria bacterium]|nr:ABC transporter substrate-binding protein [Pseudomonadota bacterium]
MIKRFEQGVWMVRGGVVLALVLALCLTLGAPTAGLAADKEFKIGCLSDLTGPFAAGTAPFWHGQQAYMRYVNEKLGGINGVQVKAIPADCQLNLDKEVAAYKRFRDVDDVLIFFDLSSAGTAALAPMAKKDKIPHMYLDEPKAIFLKGNYYFGLVPIWAETGAACFEWWLKNEWKESRPPKVALLTADYQAGYTIAIYWREYLKAKKIPIVVDMHTPLKTTDAMSYVEALRKAGADVVVTGQTPGTDVVTIKTIGSLGLKIQVIQSIPSFLASDGLRKAVGEAGVGTLMGAPNALLTETDVPAIKLVHELWKEWYPDKPLPTMSFLIGWSEMSVTCEALKRAMKKHSYEDLTKDVKKGRKILKETLENDMRGYTGDGLFAPIEWSPTNHKANAQVKVIRFGAGGALDVMTGLVAPPPLKDYQRDSKWWDAQLKK